MFARSVPTPIAMLSIFAEAKGVFEGLAIIRIAIGTLL
jgi:hypothetical protein